MLSIFIGAQTSKATFVKEVEVEYKWMIWHSYVIDSAYWKVWQPDGSLPRRSDGTFLYWAVDSNGDLIPIRKIVLRLPIFFDNPPPHIEYKGNIIPWNGKENTFYNTTLEN